MFSEYFINNYFKFSTYDEFFNAYKNHKLEKAREKGLRETVKSLLEKRLNGEYIKTIKGEVVKSLGEARIANYLFTHDMEYTYEKVYTELMDDISYINQTLLSILVEKIFILSILDYLIIKKMS